MENKDEKIAPEIEEKIKQDIAKKLDPLVEKELQELLKNAASSGGPRDIAQEIKKNGAFVDNSDASQSSLDNFSQVQESPSSLATNKQGEEANEAELNSQRNKSRQNKKNSSPVKMPEASNLNTDISTKSSSEDSEGGSEEQENRSKNSNNNSGQEESSDQVNQQSEEEKEAELNSQKTKTKKDSEKTKTKKDEDEKIDSFRKTLDKLLKESWSQIAPSWTLSMFYIYLHAFLHNIFPKYFCPLGEEHVPENIKSTSPKEAKEMGKKIGIVEKPAVGCFCAAHLFIIIIIVAIIYFILNPIEVAWNFLTEWVESITN